MQTSKDNFPIDVLPSVEKPELEKWVSEAFVIT